MNPRVSVIVPARNEALFIKRCLTQLLHQETSVTYEIIVSDNNSTDETAAIAKKMGAKVVKEPRQSPSSARNTGAKAARGDLFIFIDSDMKIPPDYIQTVTDYMDEHGDIDGIGGPYVVDDAGPFFYWFTNDFNYFSKLMGWYSLSFGCQIIASGNFAIRRQPFFAVGGFNDSIRDVIRSEDADLSIRLAKKKYVIKFLPNLKAISSSRRQRKEFFRTAFVRSYFMILYFVGFRLWQIQKFIG